MIFNSSKYNNSWSERRLSDLGTFRRGKSKHRPRNDPILFKNGKYPLIQTGEVKNSNLYIDRHNSVYNEFGLSQSSIWPKNTLCITIAANIAETSILKYPMCFPDSIVGFNANKNETSEIFMHYVFSYIRSSIQNSVSGSIQDNIDLEYLKELKFKIPKKKYQEKVISLLSSIDNKININLKINKILEDVCQSIFNYWFIQFDFPDYKNNPYRSSGGKMVFNNLLNKNIPENWSTASFGELNEVLKGDIITENLTNDGDIKVVAGGLKHAYFHSEHNRPKNTITISGSGNAGLVNFWREPIYASDCITVRGKSDSATLISLHYLKLIQEYLFYQNKGSVQGHVYPDDIKDLKFLKIPDELVDNFGEKTLEFNQKIEANIKTNEYLVSLRDWILPMLMTGQARIK